MTVFAVGLGWKMNQVRLQREAVRVLVTTGAFVAYDYEYDQNGGRRFGASPSGPAWLRRCLGDDFFAGVVSVSMDSRGAEEEEARIDRAPVKSEKTSHVRLPTPHLTPLWQLPGLQSLSLSCYWIREQEMAELADLPELRRIVFNSCEIDRAALAQLARMRQLRSLEFNSEISEEHLLRLRTALPFCTVEGP